MIRFLFASFLVSNSVLFAQEDRPLTLFLGVEGGYSILDTDTAQELNKDGYHLAVKGLLNWRQDWWSVDLGGGWLLNRMEVDDNTPPVVRELVQTRAGYIEFSPRYRHHGWEFGPIFQSMIGTDVTFSVLSKSQKVNAMAGLTGLYRWEAPIPMRVSLGAITDLSISKRQIWIITGGFQIGWPLFFGAHPENPAASSITTPAPKPKRVFSFNSDLIFFDVNSVNIRPSSHAKLAELGKFLQERHDLWKTLRVVGHTDSTGPYLYNLELSEKRADSVRRVLLEGGVARKDISSEGKSFSEPKIPGDSAEARQQNRRVELVFESDKNMQALIDKISELELENPLP